MQLITETEAAKMLSMAPGTLRYWRAVDRPNKPPSTFLGGRIRYDVALLEDWVRQQPSTSARASKE